MGPVRDFLERELKRVKVMAIDPKDEGIDRLDMYKLDAKTLGG